MMMNLFSSFDYLINFNTNFNWLGMLLFIFLISSLFWSIPSRYNMMWYKIIISLYNEFKILMPLKGSMPIFISLFSLILFDNFLGMSLYILTTTSHMKLTMSSALPL